ncbi:hypothetical protein [Natranaerofaba carboxydovora]|uniref:hypothetical protein n=1 Tax=Natranaerofaba carboxydovora TaxID=2742683 RepID=UPI001F12CA92|nr:hypothetical protein [Natranaerofaba carboxydovora]UMZ73105.1 hypothetical protein ACONDI_00656 [Natranaerofaba carboxydovora]
MLEIARMFLNKRDKIQENMKPTEIYNEGWLLRFVLDWFSENRRDIDENNPLLFLNSSKWYSEGILPTKFFPNYNRDKLAEGNTYADAIIGDIKIGKRGKGDVSFVAPYRQLIVIEAKMYSDLSQGISNANFFDQAARTVGCVAEMLAEVIDEIECYNKDIQNLESLAFYVVAPAEQLIEKDIFEKWVDKGSIKSKMKRRIEQYNMPERMDDYRRKKSWYKNIFEPTLDRIKLCCITWENIIENIRELDSNNGEEIKSFYNYCKEYNKQKKR